MNPELKKYRDLMAKLSNPAYLEGLSERDKVLVLDWVKHLKYEWSLHGRPTQQLPPGTWNKWVVVAGRGWGKTRVGAEAVRSLVQKHGYRAVGLIAATASDARDTMVDGKGGSSLIEITPQGEGLVYHPTKRRLMWKNGAQGSTFTAEEPERLRGPQHDLLWCDELAAWRYLQDTWDQAMFGFRLGKNPRAIITTTPKPLPLLKAMISDATPASQMEEGMVVDTVVTRGTTMDNVDNLAPQFIQELMKKYEGTRLGRQELYAEILDDNPGGLFKQSRIDDARVDLKEGRLRPGADVVLEYRLGRGAGKSQSFGAKFTEVVVAVDPSMSNEKSSNETGIIVMASDKEARVYLLEDASGTMTPNEWGRRIVELYQKYSASAVVAEVNQGGDLVENVIRTAQRELGVNSLNYKKVRASKGKVARAEPVGQLEEQGRIHHVGDFPRLEDQLTEFQPGYTVSPDRLDAYVWGVHHLVIQRQGRGFFIA